MKAGDAEVRLLRNIIVMYIGVIRHIAGIMTAIIYIR